MMLTAMLTMVGIYVVPAGAQHTNECPLNPAASNFCNDTTIHHDNSPTTNDVSPSQDFNQDDFSSGNFDPQSDNSIQGNGNIQCAPSQQVGPTGNSSTQQGLQPSNTNIDDSLLAGNSGENQGLEPSNANFGDADLAGNTSETSPTQTTDCAPTQNQAAAN
jgi:hypothetical protein